MILRSFYITLLLGLCYGLKLENIGDLEGFFDTVTGFEEFNANIKNLSKTSIDGSSEVYFELLIRWVKLSRDEKLQIIKNKTKNIAKMAQASINGTFGSEEIPVWPSCCGLNSETKGVFSPSLNVNKTMWPGCYEPMNPTTQTTPIFSLYEIECLCTTYSNSTKPGDKMFSYETAGAMKSATLDENQKRNQTNIQGLVLYFNFSSLILTQPNQVKVHLKYLSAISTAWPHFILEMTTDHFHHAISMIHEIECG